MNLFFRSVMQAFSKFSRLTMGVSVALLLSSCASSFEPSMYATEKPTLELTRYFNGVVDAWGMFQDRSGKIVKRFTVVMHCNWNGDTGTLDEDFTYSDGTKQKRVWTLKKPLKRLLSAPQPMSWVKPKASFRVILCIGIMCSPCP